jgi:hypothetical protein
MVSGVLRARLTLTMVAALATASVAPAQPRSATTSVEEQVAAFLAQDCGTPGETTPELRAVIDAGDAAVDLLLRAVESGPSAPALAKVEAAARAEHLRLSRMPALAPDERAYVRQRREGYALAYRERALAGLARVGGARALAALEAISPALPAGLERAAAEALARLRTAEHSRP